MRLARFILSYILVSIFGLLASIFLAQNLRVEHLAFFGLEFTFNFAWMLLASAAFGFLVTVLLFFPSRLALTLHSRRLEHESDDLAQQVALLEEQREHLLARHEDLLAGHEDLLASHEDLLYQHHRLLSDYRRALAEREQLHARLATLETTLRRRYESQNTQKLDTQPERPEIRRDISAPVAVAALVPVLSPRPPAREEPPAPPEPVTPVLSSPRSSLPSAPIPLAATPPPATESEPEAVAPAISLSAISLSAISSLSASASHQLKLGISGISRIAEPSYAAVAGLVRKVLSR